MLHHDTPLVSTIVAGLVLAFVLGAVANRFRMPPLIGYLVAGVVVGPFTPGFVADAELAFQLSEIGVILLMFGVGLHFSLRDLLSVRAIAIPGALVQIAGGTAMGLGLALAFGWGLGAGLIFGLALSVASTVVLLKALQDRRLVDSERGRIAVGWLIVEDVTMVLALVLIPAIATLTGATALDIHDPFVSFVERIAGTDLGLAGVLAVTLVKLAAFVGFMLVVGQRAIPYVLHFTAHTGSRELFRLAVLAIALGVAAGAAYLFGVSLALGAFLAGMILSESELSHRAAEESLPLRDAFAVLFFVSVGMLFDPAVLLVDPLPILATVLIIVVGKSVLAFFVVRLFRGSVGTALTIAASLAQIGEFSFILASIGVLLGILPDEGRDLILAGAILSILVNPLVFWISERLRPMLQGGVRGETGAARTEPALVAPGVAAGAAQPAEAAAAPQPTALSAHTVLVGYGRVGRVVAEGLIENERPFVLIEDAEGRVAAAQAAGLEVITGNAASPQVLQLANVAAAKAVVLAIPNAFEAGQATEQCRLSNPGIYIVARAHSKEEAEHLRHLGADKVIIGEREIALGMLDWVEQSRGPIIGGSPLDAVAAARAGPKDEADDERPAEIAAAAVPAAVVPAVMRRPARRPATPYDMEPTITPAGGQVPEVLPEPGGS